MQAPCFRDPIDGTVLRPDGDDLVSPGGRRWPAFGGGWDLRPDRADDNERLQAGIYDEKLGELTDFDHPHNLTLAHQRDLLTALEVPQGGRVLEIGGHRSGALPWFERHHGAIGSGVDVSPVWVQAHNALAAARGVETRWVLGTAEALPYEDGAFDAVVAFDVFEHVSNLNAALREAARVLRPGGVALVMHEGVSGILRNNRFTGIRSVHEIDWQKFSWNEQVFWLHEYLGAARRAGLKSRPLLAPFIIDRLEAGNFSGLLFGRIGRIASRLWRLPGGRQLLSSRLSVWAASYLVGMPLTAMMRRP